MTPVVRHSRVFRWLIAEPTWLRRPISDSALFGGAHRVLSHHWAGSRSRAAMQRRWVGRLFGTVALVLVVAISHPTLRVGWAALLIGAVASVWMIRLVDQANRWVERLFLWALVARVVMAVLLYLVSPRVWIPTEAGVVQNGGFFVGDGHVYAFNGEWIASRWMRNVFPSDRDVEQISMSKSSTPFNYWTGVITYWLGYHPLTMFFVSCLFGAWGSVLLYWIARLYLHERGARIAGVLGACWPSLFLWSTQNLKEPLSNLLLLAALYCWLVPVGWRRWLPVRLAGVVAAWWLNLLNPFIGPLLTVAIILAVLMCRPWSRAVLAATLLTALVLVTTPQGAVILTNVAQRLDAGVFGRPVLELAVDPKRFVGVIEYMRRVRMEESRTPFLEVVRLETPEHLIRFLPLGLMGLLTMPAPWAARSFSECLGALEMLLWYPLMLFAFRGGLRTLLRGAFGPQLLLVTALVIASALALLEGNVGTLFRHRAALWPFLLLFVAWGLDGERSRLEVRHG